MIRRLFARWFTSEAQLVRGHQAVVDLHDQLVASLAADLAERQAAAQELTDQLVRLSHRRSLGRQALLDAEQRLAQLWGLV